MTVTQAAIISTCEEVYAETIQEITATLSRLQTDAVCRRFLVARMGSTGSTWLAKVINSHPEVFCSHERIVSRIFPAREYDNADILTFIAMLAQMNGHGAYSAMGDVGSVWTTHLAAVRHAFTTGLLIRHPARILHTRLRVFPADRSFTVIEPAALRCIRLLWDIPAEQYDEIDQIFLQDAFFFASQVRVLHQIDLLLRIEDLADPLVLADSLQRLTGAEYDLATLERLARIRINSRTAALSITEILDSFSPRQRDWYRMIFTDVLPSFGYTWDHDRLQTGGAPHRKHPLAVLL